MQFNTKYGEVIVYAKTVEQDAVSQVLEMANSPLGKGAHIRIMPDCHAGAGCVIGTTMLITDKVCPNLVGVDIGCGVDLVKTDIDFSPRLNELDAVIRAKIPFGMQTHADEHPWPFDELLCWQDLDRQARVRAMTALGTLGGGNHFIEAYADGWLSVHSGSRNIGYKVAEFYQNLAARSVKARNRALSDEAKALPTDEREAFLKENRITVSRDLAFLTGDEMRAYLHDVAVLQRFANDNRRTMLNAITDALGGTVSDHISSIHNYIDTDAMILRKGAIAANAGQLLVIPLNMRDGLLLCRGKGNPEWNFSAPHGAGRLYSRSKAKALFSVEEYEREMRGIFSTCIGAATLDEAPFVYKDYLEISECIEPTVEIIDRLIPIFNFKASD